MRLLAALLLLLATLLPLSAEDWTTTDGTTYKNVTVVQVSDDGLTITYDGGTTKLPYYNLPLDVQKTYGHDPDTLAAKQKEADDAEAARKAAALTAEQQAEALKKQQADDAVQVKALDAARAANHATPSAPSGTSTLVPDRVADRVTYPGAEYSFNKFQNICYFDSPAATSQPLPAMPEAQAGHTSLILRVGTYGNQPMRPEKLLVTIRSIGTTWKLTDNHDILFLVDGASIPVDPEELRDSDFLPGFGQVVESVSFFMTPEQVKSIIFGKSVKFYIGGTNYSVDQPGLDNLRKFMAAVDELPVAPSALSQKYTEVTNNMPSIPTMISKTCEYVILGGFSIAIFLGFAACCIGAARFMRW